MSDPEQRLAELGIDNLSDERRAIALLLLDQEWFIALDDRVKRLILSIPEHGDDELLALAKAERDPDGRSYTIFLGCGDAHVLVYIELFHCGSDEHEHMPTVTVASRAEATSDQVVMAVLFGPLVPLQPGQVFGSLEFFGRPGFQIWRR